MPARPRPRFLLLAAAALVVGALGALGAAADNDRGASVASPSTTAPPTPRPSASATASPGEMQVTISGDSPFADCRTTGEGRNYRGAEVEPWIAVNPVDSANMIVVWQQDRWSNGAARGLVTSVTHDGGATWRTITPPFSACAAGGASGAEYKRASDPWVSFGPTGIAYQTSLSVAGRLSAILVSRSTDGGDTWSAPTTLIRERETHGSNDKESVTAHPTNAALAYVVWNRTRPPAEGGAPRQGRPGRSEIMLARTSDAGRSWERARVIATVDGTPLGNQIAVLPDGTLINVYNLVAESNSRPRLTQVAIRSGDGGETWSVPTVIAEVRNVAIVDPEARDPVRSGFTLPEIAVAAGGTVYLTWPDGRFSDGRQSDIAISRSTDGGRTWSSPAKVNSTPDGHHAFTATVDVTRGGVIGVSYYDVRADRWGTPTLLTDRFLSRSTDGGATWTETRLTASSFDIRAAPFAGGWFLGDYVGMAAAGERFVSSLVVTNSGEPADRTRIVFQSTPP